MTDTIDTTRGPFRPYVPPAVIKGVDVSRWQHPGGHSINWMQVYEAGYRFAIVEVTYGLDGLNEYGIEDLRQAHEAGLEVGAYHYAIPNEGDAEAQAIIACKAVEGVPLSFGVALDLEEDGTLSHYQVGDWARAFAGTVNQHRHACPIYSYASFAETLGGYPFGHRAWWAPDPIPVGLQVSIQQDWAQEVPGIESPTDIDYLYRSRWVHSVTPASTGPVAVSGVGDVAAELPEAATAATEATEGATEAGSPPADGPTSGE